MQKVNINFIATEHSKYGIENVTEWDSLHALNKHIAAISKQKDWQMYFPMEAVLKLKNSDGTLHGLKLLRINKPIVITF